MFHVQGVAVNLRAGRYRAVLRPDLGAPTLWIM